MWHFIPMWSHPWHFQCCVGCTSFSEFSQPERCSVTWWHSQTHQAEPWHSRRNTSAPVSLRTRFYLLFITLGNIIIALLFANTMPTLIVCLLSFTPTCLVLVSEWLQTFRQQCSAAWTDGQTMWRSINGSSDNLWVSICSTEHVVIL